MTADQKRLINSMENFFKKFINITESQTGSLPSSEYNPDWLSPCLQLNEYKPAGNKTNSCDWMPVRRENNNDLAGIETALEITVHPAIKTFFTAFWSDHIDAIYQQGNLTLLFVWNDTDMENLIKNLLGHALDRLRNHYPLSFFIACTPTDYIISVDNTSGQVVLERPGRKAEKILTPTLKDFFDDLEPGIIV